MLYRHLDLVQPSRTGVRQARARGRANILSADVKALFLLRLSIGSFKLDRCGPIAAAARIRSKPVGAG